VSTEEKYVAAVYLVVFLVLLAYVFIIALKLQRLERELTELVEAAKRPVRAERGPVEEVWGNREVPPASQSGRRG
jgi:CcmD family protein